MLADLIVGDHKVLQVAAVLEPGREPEQSQRDERIDGSKHEKEGARGGVRERWQ